MSDKKKSFVAYSDWYGTFKALPDDIAGRLIKHVFSYVNDENPTTDDFMVNALFEQIKSTLIRDKVKWEDQREQRVQAGLKSAEIRAAKSNERSTKSNERSNSLNETERNPTVSVNDSVSVSVNKSKSIDDRLLAFQEQLKPFVQEYGEVMIKEFYFYWTEKNLDAKKMRFEKEAVFDIKRRLARWSNNNFNSNKKTQINEQPYLPTADKAAIAAKYGKPNSTS